MQKIDEPPGELEQLAAFLWDLRCPGIEQSYEDHHFYQLAAMKALEFLDGKS
jgi:hypothetical protein